MLETLTTHSEVPSAPGLQMWSTHTLSLTERRQDPSRNKWLQIWGSVWSLPNCKLEVTVTKTTLTSYTDCKSREFPKAPSASLRHHWIHTIHGKLWYSQLQLIRGERIQMTISHNTRRKGYCLRGFQTRNFCCPLPMDSGHLTHPPSRCDRGKLTQTSVFKVFIGISVLRHDWMLTWLASVSRLPKTPQPKAVALNHMVGGFGPGQLAL